MFSSSGLCDRDVVQPFCVITVAAFILMNCGFKPQPNVLLGYVKLRHQQINWPAVNLVSVLMVKKLKNS